MSCSNRPSLLSAVFLALAASTAGQNATLSPDTQSPSTTAPATQVPTEVPATTAPTAEPSTLSPSLLTAAPSDDDSVTFTVVTVGIIVAVVLCALFLVWYYNRRPSKPTNAVNPEAYRYNPLGETEEAENRRPPPLRAIASRESEYRQPPPPSYEEPAFEPEPAPEPSPSPERYLASPADAPVGVGKGRGRHTPASPVVILKSRIYRRDDATGEGDHGSVSVADMNRNYTASPAHYV